MKTTVLTAQEIYDIKFCLNAFANCVETGRPGVGAKDLDGEPHHYLTPEQKIVVDRMRNLCKKL